MNQNRISEYLLQLEERAEEFCRETGGLSVETESEYKRNGDKGDIRDLKFKHVRIHYNSFTCDFKYTAHSFMNVTNSILECYVYSGKTEYDVAVPLQFWVDYLDLDVATPLSIPYITNKDGMNEAFGVIAGVLGQLLGRISELLCDPDKKTELLYDFDSEYRYICDVKYERSEVDAEELSYEYDYYCRFLTLRYTSAAFLQYMNGNVERAVKELKKQKKLLDYEQRMLRIWNEEQPSVESIMPSVVKNSANFIDLGVSKNDFKDFSVIFVSWIALTLLTSPFYLALFLGTVYLEGRDSVYLIGPYYNIPCCILAGFVTAIALSYFTRFWFYRKLRKKDYERYRELDELQNGKGSDRIMHGFLAVIIGVGCVACVLFAKWNVNFGERGLTDSGKFFSLHREYHSYGEIERVYYRPDRQNDFGATLDCPSYVIEFSDGSELDLYEYGETEKYERELLPILEEKGVTVCYREPN